MLIIPTLYFYGVYAWQTRQFSNLPETVNNGKEIYFICFSSALYAAASVGFLLSKTWWLKLISSTVSSVCFVIVFEEVKYGNKQWTQWSYWIIGIAAFNYFIFYCIIERYKKEINYGG